MTPAPETPRINRKRRIVLGWGGVGLITFVAGFLGWRTAQRTGGPAVPNASSPRAAKDPNSTPDDLASNRAPEPPVIDPTREKFLPHLGSEFQVEVDGVPRDVKLIEISPASRIHGKGATYTAFTLLFEAADAYKFESQIYKIKHESMGHMELFLSPVGQLKKHAYIEAAFTHRV